MRRSTVTPAPHLRRALLALVALGVAVAAGCYSTPASDVASPSPGAANAPPLGSSAAGRGGDAASLARSGIPCDVATVLATSCTDCHGATLAEGATVSLVTYDDLASPSRSDPTRTVAAVAADRVKDAKRPMPPDDTLSASDLAALEQWVAAGLPRRAAACDAPAHHDEEDGGAAPKSAPDGGDVADAAPAIDAGDGGVCSSGTTWTSGARGSESMHPGAACLACHAQTSGPAFAVAGTVYPTLHEPNDCNGSSSPNLKVVLVDAYGKTHTIAVNDAGNFMRPTSLSVPYRAMVTDGANIRQMNTPQTNGDCNSCHGEAGGLAPGRILAP